MIIAFIVTASFLFWLATLVIGSIGARQIRTLHDHDIVGRERWPRVSLLIPARDEIRDLGSSVEAHLQSDYPDLEIVLVDDRSSDGTGKLVDALAERDSRISGRHIRELPEGWLGKVYALSKAEEAATGDWLLLVDADIHLAPDTIRRCISLCESEGLDFLTAIPKFLPVQPFLDAAVTTMTRIVFGGGQCWKAEDPNSSKAAGFGALILTRRSVFQSSEGFRGLRMEVADDIGMGQIVKQAGGRCVVVNAREHVSLSFYHSLAEMRGSIEKGGFGIAGRYTLWRTLAMTTLSFSLELGFLLALLPGNSTTIQLLGLAAMLTGVLATSLGNWWLDRPLATSLLFPVGSFLNSWYVLRSGLIGWWQGGIRWRDTFYPISELKKGQIVFFP